MKVALTGVSHWHGDYHGMAFSEAGAEIVGAFDEDSEKIRAFVTKYGGNVYASIEEMVEKSQADFVMAMGRHVDMPEIAQTLLEMEVPFGIEKPIGLRAEDLVPILEKAEKKGTFIAVPLINRYSLMWQKIEELEKQNRFGQKIHGHFKVVNGTAERYDMAGVSWMLQPEISGGGSLRNLGIHGADAFIMFSGIMPEVLSAQLCNTDRGYRVEEYSAALVRGNDVVGILESGYTYASRAAGGDFEWRVASTNAYIIDRGKTLTLATLDDGKTETFNNLIPAERYKMFGRDTLERLSKGRPPIADLKDCYKAMQLLDVIYAKSGRDIS